MHSILTGLLVATVMASTSVSTNEYAKQRVFEEFGDDPVMLCIIENESRFEHFDKIGNVKTGFNKNKTFDTGIAQINSLAWQETLYHGHGIDVNTVDGNLEAAHIVLREQGYEAWYTYEKYCKNL